MSGTCVVSAKGLTPKSIEFLKLPKLGANSKILHSAFSCGIAYFKYEGVVTVKLGLDFKDPSTARGIVGLAVSAFGAWLIITGRIQGDPISELLLLGVGVQGMLGAGTVSSKPPGDAQ